MRVSMKGVAGVVVLISAALAAGAASAAELTVEFTAAGPAPVPFSPLTITVLALGLAAAAVVIMRKRGMGNGLAFGLAAMIGLVGLSTTDAARAAESFTLTGSSPQAFPLQNNGGPTTITNGTGVDVTIDAVTVDGPYVVIDGTCVGEIVPAGDSCDVFVSQPL